GQPDPEVCNLPADTGPCKAKMPRWYFNSETRECETFIYGGCRGNANNFLSRQLCLLTCALGTRDCEAPADPGPCKGYFPRWFFDVETSKCEQFIYGGCQGNLNNYYSKEQCESTCMRTHNCTCCTDVFKPASFLLQPPLKKKPSRFRNVGSLSYGFGWSAFFPLLYRSTQPDRSLSKVLPFHPVFLCRDAAAAQVLGRSRHQETDFERDCLPEADSGPCFGYFPSWYFNVESGKCESFTYGGCKGNNNNYYVHADCVKTCEQCEFPAHTCVPCFLPKKVGPCKAAIPRYYFDPNTGQCEPFTYGGCQGNANNFKTVKECLRFCNPIEGRSSDADVCKRPAKPGMCAGYFPRWFFNTKTGKCEEFVYGGCQSNGNNFATLEQCQYTCPNTTLTGHGNDTCSLPKKVGPCRAAMPRYYFDVTTGKCERFIYGGCEGNANNFHTLQQCQRTCKGRPTTPPPPPPPPQPHTHTPTQHRKAPVTLLIYHTRDAVFAANMITESVFEDTSHMSEDNFYNQSDCHSHSHHDCESPKDPGPCFGYFPRWFFNVDTSECEEFIYGGCQGNDNNYWSLEQCQRTCARGTSLRGT
ncbi:unnamed protein product, partial [Ixodes pacificus]